MPQKSEQEIMNAIYDSINQSMNIGFSGDASSFSVSCKSSDARTNRTSCLSDDGSHLRVSSGIFSLQDRFGWIGKFSPIGDLRVSEPFRLAGVTFGNEYDNNFWVSGVSSTGSLSISNSVATVTTGVSGSSYAFLRSMRRARFIFAHPMLWRGAIRIPDITETNVIRRFGAFTNSDSTVTDGIYYEIDGTGTLSLKVDKGGSNVYSVSSGSFNGEVASYTLDTNVHAFEIVYFTMGVWFLIDNVLIHKFTPTSTTFGNTMQLPINIMGVNGVSGTESGDIECWNSVIMRLGRSETAERGVYTTGTGSGVLKYGAGDCHRLILTDIQTNMRVVLRDGTTSSGSTIFDTGTLASTNAPVDLELGALPFYDGLHYTLTAGGNILINYE